LFRRVSGPFINRGDAVWRSAEAKTIFVHIAEQHRLLAAVDAELRHCGYVGGVSAALRQAFMDCPRHLFVDRYQVARGGAVLQYPQYPQYPRSAARAGETAQHLQLVYSNIGLGHVGSDGQPLASVNSPPSHVLHILELSQLAAGQNVLEIGSGCGWLLGLAARAVSPRGHAMGIEILPALAAQSRHSLARAGISNATVAAADGAGGHAALAPFDRVIFTAGLWALPLAFFDQVAEGGLLVAPFQIKGGCNDFIVLRKMAGRRFRSEAVLPAMFVDVSGGITGLPHTPAPLRTLPLWEHLADRKVLSLPMTFGLADLGGLDKSLFGWRTAAFRSFLQKIDPRMYVFTTDIDPSTPESRVLRASGVGADTVGVGLVDEEAASLAVCTNGELAGYGTPDAARDLLAVYRRWTDLLMPGAEAFEVELVEASAAPPPRPGLWVEQRGPTAMLWSLRADRPSVSDLLARPSGARQAA
jgi:protein-L-isoaspartate(D-aspartate) O-methyltransferase